MNYLLISKKIEKNFIEPMKATTEMPYTQVSFQYALTEMNLFDNILGKYLKYYMSDEFDCWNEDDLIEIEIKGCETNDTRDYICGNEVIFELKNPNYNPNAVWSEDRDTREEIEFSKKYIYNGSSATALMFCHILQDLEESDEEEEDEEEKEEEFIEVSNELNTSLEELNDVLYEDDKNEFIEFCNKYIKSKFKNYRINISHKDFKKKIKLIK